MAHSLRSTRASAPQRNDCFPGQGSNPISAEDARPRRCVNLSCSSSSSLGFVLFGKRKGYEMTGASVGALQGHVNGKRQTSKGEYERKGRHGSNRVGNCFCCASVCVHRGWLGVGSNFHKLIADSRRLLFAPLRSPEVLGASADGFHLQSDASNCDLNGPIGNGIGN